MGDPSEVFADALASLKETLADTLRQSWLDNYFVMGFFLYNVCMGLLALRLTIRLLLIGCGVYTR